MTFERICPARLIEVTLFQNIHLKDPSSISRFHLTLQYHSQQPSAKATVPKHEFLCFFWEKQGSLSWIKKWRFRENLGNCLIFLPQTGSVQKCSKFANKKLVYQNFGVKVVLKRRVPWHLCWNNIFAISGVKLGQNIFVHVFRNHNKNAKKHSRQFFTCDSKGC